MIYKKEQTWYMCANKEWKKVPIHVKTLFPLKVLFDVFLLWLLSGLSCFNIQQKSSSMFLFHLLWYLCSMSFISQLNLSASSLLNASKFLEKKSKIWVKKMYFDIHGATYCHVTFKFFIDHELTDISTNKDSLFHLGFG